MKKLYLLIILTSLLFAYILGQVQEQKALQARLDNCITSDFQYLPTDYCLSGHGGYEVK